MQPLFSYQGKWALITGASRGIGAEIARMMAREGIHLYLQYGKSFEEAKQVADTCRRYGIEVLLIQSDLLKDGSAEHLISQLPRIPDYLINNAGIAHYSLFSDATEEEWRKVQRINLEIPVFLCRQVLPAMLQRGFGRIINISSVWGTSGAAMEVLYSTGKGGLNAFTRSLAKEIAAAGITVNAVAPGAVLTDMLYNHLSGEDLEMLKQEIPARRLAHPEDVAYAVMYLLSDQASYVTGQILHCDGGWQ